MKAGILTMHCVKNFGAMLQAYALQEQIISFGHDCCIIDYVPPIRSDINYLFPFYGYPINLRSLLSIIKWFPVRVRSIKPFESFMYEKLNLTTVRYKSYSELASIEGFDAFVCGSDQIWNPDCNNGIDQAFFAGFAKESIKRIAYAASVGKGNLRAEDLDKIAEYAANMDSVSVRERSTAELLEKQGIARALHVVDPVLLVGRGFWEKATETVEIDYRKKYLLLYILGDSPLIIKKGCEIARRRGLEVVKVGWDILTPHGVDRCFSNKSPFDFVKLLQEAEYIVTNSFHGTAFSMIFEKPFIAVPHNNNPRFTSVLNQYGLQARAYCKDCEADNDDIDYTHIRTLMHEQRMLSLDFLEQALIEGHRI